MIIRRSIIAGLLALAVTPVTCAQSSAEPLLKVFKITKIEHGVSGSDPIAACKFDNNTCRIDSGKTVTTTFSGEFGISVSAINAKAGASYAESYTTMVGCTAENVKPGQTVFQFPLGDRVHFESSAYGKGWAFFPYGPECRIYNDGDYSKSWWRYILNLADK